MSSSRRGSLCIDYADAELCGYDWNTAALLTWFRKCQTKNPNGFSVSQTKIQNAVGLTRYQQETARRKLRDLGVLVEEKRDMPAKLYFNVVDITLTGCGKPATKDAGNQHTVVKQELESIPSERQEKPTETRLVNPLQNAENQQPRMWETSNHACQQTNNQYFISSEKKKERKGGSLTQVTSKPKTPSLPPASSEELFEEQLRRRANGENLAKTSIDQSRWQRHLQNLIGSNWTHKQVQANWQRWYRDFGVDFVETAWNIAVSSAESHSTGKPVLAFVDLFDSYGNYRELALLMQEKKRGQQENTRAAPPKIQRGQDALLNGERVHVQEVDHEGYFAYLGDAEGTRVRVAHLEAIA